MIDNPGKALCFVGVASALLTFASSQTAGPEGRVTAIFHDVQLLPSNADPHAAAIDDAVNEGNALRTGNDSRSELTFADLTITRLGENTIFTVNKAGRSVHLDSGAILLYVRKDSGGAEISTKAVSVGITGTTLIFETQPAHHDRLTVLEGVAQFRLNDHPEQTASVRAGYVLNVNAGAKKLPKPGRVDLRRVMQTHPLIKDFPPLPSFDLIVAEMKKQNPKAQLPSSQVVGSAGATGPPPPPLTTGHYHGPVGSGSQSPGAAIPTTSAGTSNQASPIPTPTVKPTRRPRPRGTPRPSGTQPKYSPNLSSQPTAPPPKIRPSPKRRPRVTPTPGQIIR